MGQEPIFSAAGRRNMVKTSSEAVRPSLNVTNQEETISNSLSHHGDTAIRDDTTQEQDNDSTTSRMEAEEGQERNGEEDDRD